MGEQATEAKSHAMQILSDLGFSRETIVELLKSSDHDFERFQRISLAKRKLFGQTVFDWGNALVYFAELSLLQQREQMDFQTRKVYQLLYIYFHVDHLCDCILGMVNCMQAMTEPDLSLLPPAYRRLYSELFGVRDVFSLSWQGGLSGPGGAILLRYFEDHLHEMSGLRSEAELLNAIRISLTQQHFREFRPRDYPSSEVKDMRHRCGSLLELVMVQAIYRLPTTLRILLICHYGLEEGVNAETIGELAEVLRSTSQDVNSSISQALSLLRDDKTLLGWLESRYFNSSLDVLQKGHIRHLSSNFPEGQIEISGLQ